MIIMYILLIAYILAINFYSFLLVKGLRDEEREENARQAAPLSVASAPATEPKKNDKGLGKLFAAAALGGAITIYVCMFIFKYRRANLLLMITMPLLAVLNVYIWVLLFRSGFTFFAFR